MALSKSLCAVDVQQQKEKIAIRRPMRAARLPVAKDGPRINDDIREREVHLIDRDGANRGTVSISDALALARRPASTSSRFRQRQPPVCKLLDFGKYNFKSRRTGEARKSRKIVEIKEVKFRPMIDDHDYDVKMRSMIRFFGEGDKVKVTLRFRGREMAHQELGIQLLDRLKGDTEKVAKVEMDARFEGRQMVMVLAPR